MIENVIFFFLSTLEVFRLTIKLWDEQKFKCVLKIKVVLIVGTSGPKVGLVSQFDLTAVSERHA